MPFVSNARTLTHTHTHTHTHDLGSSEREEEEGLHALFPLLDGIRKPYVLLVHNPRRKKRDNQSCSTLLGEKEREIEMERRGAAAAEGLVRPALAAADETMRGMCN